LSLKVKCNHMPPQVPDCGYREPDGTCWAKTRFGTVFTCEPFDVYRPEEPNYVKKSKSRRWRFR